jgi:hypothetical protein
MKPRADVEDTQSELTTPSLPDDLETSNKHFLVAQTFGQRATAEISSDSSKSDTEDIDVCETLSFGTAEQCGCHPAFPR